MKWLRWIAIVIGTLVALVAIAGFALYGIGGSKLARKVEVQAYPIDVPSDPASIEEGCRLAQVNGCADCHGESLQGQVMFDNGLARLVAPHIAPGRGSVTADYTVDDWLRSIRHGVSKDGHPLVVMPSRAYHDELSGEDVAKIIACCMSAGPIDNELPESEYRAAKIFVAAGIFGLDYDDIDHGAPPRSRPDSSDTIALGEYMTASCRSCHGADLMGGSDPEFGGPQLARDGGVIDTWEHADFSNFFSTGVTPAGRQIDSERMPWDTLGYMTDEELYAVWTYLRTVSAPAR